jgi:hypothetical protein
MRYRHDPTDLSGAWNIVRSAKAKVLSLVRQRIDAQDSQSTPLEKADVEMILAALLSCTIASVRRPSPTAPAFPRLIPTLVDPPPYVSPSSPAQS